MRSPPARLLIVRLGAVGDVIRTLPLAHALRAVHPDTTLDWVVEPASAGLLRAIAVIDHVHVLERGAISRALRRPWRWPRAAREIRKLSRELASRRHDVVLDVHGTAKSAMVAHLARGRRTEGLAPGGSKEGAHLFYDAVHPFPAAPMTRIQRALFLGAASGLLGENPPRGGADDPRLDFGLRFPPERTAAVLSAATGRGPLVVLYPFASQRGQLKRWPIARHVALGRDLARAGARVMLAWGSRGEGEEARDAIAAAAAEAELELAPHTDLVELCELLRLADLVVTGDTGPMHLAAAVGTRVLALFGASDPFVNAPWGTQHRVLVHPPLAMLPVAVVGRVAQELLSASRRN